MVALIPARAGSKRVVGKNTKLLNGVPLIAYTIAAAWQSGVFERVVVCTDDPLISMESGVTIIHRRDAVPDDQPDIVWVREVLQVHPCESFAILRPTSPFRDAVTIQRAYEQFMTGLKVDSIRAVERVTQHPAKMWGLSGTDLSAGQYLVPFMPIRDRDGTPWHSKPTQSLPRYFIQNSSLEMAWTEAVTRLGSISGSYIGPFFTEGYEGFAIDTPEDWAQAERIAQDHPELLPQIGVSLDAA